MQDAKVRNALIAICLACLLGSSLVLYAGRRSVPPLPVVIISPSVASSSSLTPTPSVEAAVAVPGPPPQPPARIYVDVAGEVRRPSLYALPPGSRVMQAIVAAGGATVGADLDAINLAQKLADGEKIFVPKRSTLPPASGVSSASSAPAAESSHPLTRVAKTSLPSRSNKVTADSGQPIALNTATVEELQRLPTVGPAMAARILSYRAQSGGFGKIEDLMQVTGIGPKKFAKIAPCVKLN